MKKAVKSWILVLPLLGLFLAGCSTTTTYHEASPSQKATTDEYPIPVYTEGMTVPRPCRLLGTVVIGDDYFTVGGTVEKEMKKVMKAAHEKGADIVQIQSIKKPGYTDANYGLTADLLAYRDPWETIGVSAAQFQAYLKANQANLDPIEGVWYGRGLIPHYLAIMRDTSTPGRDFVGFILGSQNPAWHQGYKKIDIQRGSQPNTYILDFYLDNFSHRQATVVLNASFTFNLLMERSENDDGNDDVTYIKNW